MGEDFENSGIPDVVWYNLKKRKENFPEDLVIFLVNNGVEYYCLDVSRLNAEGECAIVIWDNIEKKVSEKLDMTFGEFLLDDFDQSFEE